MMIQLSARWVSGYSNSSLFFFALSLPILRLNLLLFLILTYQPLTRYLKLFLLIASLAALLP